MDSSSRSVRVRRWTLFAGAPVALVVAFGGAFMVATSHPGPEDHRDPLVARRYVALEGTRNLRDLGGYETADGKRVRWGLVYRSDNLARLSDGDLDRLSKLGLRKVIDFRASDERAAAPSRLPPGPPGVVELDVFEPGVGERIKEALLAGRHFDMQGAYREAVSRYAAQFARMFELLATDEAYPLLFHCTAGRDRTGVAAAILLRVLGVPPDRVYEDYLLSNYYTATSTERRVALAPFRTLFRVRREQVRHVLEARREYLDAAFDAMNEQSGSFDGYRRTALGVGDDDLRALRGRLLEDAGARADVSPAR